MNNRAKKINGLSTIAYKCYDGQLGLKEEKAPEFYDKAFFLGNLITRKYKSPKGVHRGLHMSAANEEYICPIWLGLGWVDAGYEFCKNIIKEFGLEDKVKLNPRKNDWVKI